MMVQLANVGSLKGAIFFSNSPFINKSLIRPGPLIDKQRDVIA